MFSISAECPRGRGRCALPNEALWPSELTVARHRRPRKPSPPTRRLLTHPKCLCVRSPVESIRGTKLRTSRRRPIIANRSRPKCLRCSSVRRAQPLRPSCRRPAGSSMARSSALPQSEAPCPSLPSEADLDADLAQEGRARRTRPASTRQRCPGGQPT
jgi:hypothetical protein